MAYNGKVITWNDVPVYDKWGIDDYWSADNWIEWYNALKKHFGKEQARQIWNYAFSRGTFGAAHTNFSSFSPDFIDFVKRNQLDDNATWYGQIFKTTTTVVDGIVDTIDNTIGGVKNAGKTLRVIIPVAAVGLAVYWGFRLYKMAKK